MASKFVSKDRLELFLVKLKEWITTYLTDNSYVKDASYTHTDSNFTADEKTKLAGIEANANNYTLPTASASTMGGVKIGDNIEVTSDGTISVPAMDWANINNKPTALSAFTNDEGFITKAVTDLTNYYKKSETYTQEEVNNLLSSMSSISFEIVTTLPTIGQNGVFYLVAHSHGTGDVYDEYVWIESQSSFEKIGNTDVDLSNYWSKTDLTECTEDEIIALFS